MKVAYLGAEKSSTFTEKIAREIFNANYEFVPLRPIINVINAVETEKTDFGVVPIENLINGEVRETLDFLTETSKTKIIQEKALKIVHCLGTLRGNEKINEVYSKDQALEQCSKYLYENYPNAILITTSDTAEGAGFIAKQNILEAGAIASEQALKDAGLEIIARDICPNNKTRFVVLGRDYAKPTGDDKTFLAIHPVVRDRPGVLADTLIFFRDRGINLEYIQSRPDKDKGYYFYLELNGHKDEKNIEESIKNLRNYLLDLSVDKNYNPVKILGSYKNTHWKDEN